MATAGVAGGARVGDFPAFLALSVKLFSLQARLAGLGHKPALHRQPCQKILFAVFVCILTISGFNFGRAQSATRGNPLSIAGIVTLGQPFAVLRCRSSIPVYAEDYGPTGICTWPDTTTMDHEAQIIYFRKSLPPIGIGMRVYLRKGVVVDVAFETNGAKDQLDVLEKLTEKYGPPSGQRKRLLENSFGASIVSHDAVWQTDLIYAEFQGITFGIDKGWLDIMTIAEHEARIAGERRRRKL